jgi:hypothetical protein
LLIDFEVIVLVVSGAAWITLPADILELPGIGERDRQDLDARGGPGNQWNCHRVCPFPLRFSAHPTQERASRGTVRLYRLD